MWRTPCTNKTLDSKIPFEQLLSLNLNRKTQVKGINLCPILLFVQHSILTITLGGMCDCTPFADEKMEAGGGGG